MSVDYFPGMKIQTSPLQYMNDTIIRGVKSLVKQEKFVLETENDQLKRNNDDLRSRIQDLYNEFDISTRASRESNEKYTDAVGRIKHLEKRTKRAHSKKIDLLKDKYGQAHSLSDLKSQLAASQDSISLMKMQNRESDSEFQIKNTEIEILEEQNRALKARIREMENNNKDLQIRNKSMSTLVKHARETSINRKKHKNIGFSVSLEDKDDSHSIILRAEETSAQMLSPTMSSHYLDVFDNKERADAYFGDRRQPLRNAGAKKFFVENSHPNETQKNSDYMLQSPKSPIYIDIKSSRKHKYTSTEPLLDHNSIHGSDKKQPLFVQTESRLPQDVDGEFAKLSHANRLLHDKLDLLSSNIKNPSMHAEDKDPLLKKTSEEIEKISEEQQQIINMLTKNSRMLEQLQHIKESSVHNGICSPKEKDDRTSNKKPDDKIKRKNNRSGQTELVLSDESEATTKVNVSQIQNEKDVFRLISDQNHKIQDLSNRVSLIQQDSQSSLQNTNDRSLDTAEKGEQVTIKSQTSFEEISTLTDVINSTSEKGTWTISPIVDNNKISSYLRLSTTESQHNHIGAPPANASLTAAYDVTDHVPNDTQSGEMNCSEDIIKKTTNPVEAEPSTVNTMKHSSRIPKLITSRSFEIPERKEFESDRRVFSNDLESSYETLYDPMSSARFDGDTLVSI